MTVIMSLIVVARVIVAVRVVVAPAVAVRVVVAPAVAVRVAVAIRVVVAPVVAVVPVVVASRVVAVEVIHSIHTLSTFAGSHARGVHAGWLVSRLCWTSIKMLGNDLNLVVLDLVW